MKTKIGILMISSLLLIACQQYYVSEPSQASEAALVANSYDNGLSQELNINYIKAFQQLKNGYRLCIAYTRPDDLVFSDSKLEQHIEMATIFSRNQDGRYLSKVTLESLGPSSTRLTLFLPKNYRAPKARFKDDLQWAMGSKKNCT